MILVVDWVCLQKIVLSIYLVIGRTRRGKKEETAARSGKNTYLRVRAGLPDHQRPLLFNFQNLQRSFAGQTTIISEDNVSEEKDFQKKVFRRKSFRRNQSLSEERFSEERLSEELF